MNSCGEYLIQANTPGKITDAENKQFTQFAVVGISAVSSSILTFSLSLPLSSIFVWNYTAILLVPHYMLFIWKFNIRSEFLALALALSRIFLLSFSVTHFSVGPKLLYTHTHTRKHLMSKSIFQYQFGCGTVCSTIRLEMYTIKMDMWDSAHMENMNRVSWISHATD